MMAVMTIKVTPTMAMSLRRVEPAAIMAPWHHHETHMSVRSHLMNLVQQREQIVITPRRLPATAGSGNSRQYSEKKRMSYKLSGRLWRPMRRSSFRWVKMWSVGGLDFASLDSLVVTSWNNYPDWRKSSKGQVKFRALQDMSSLALGFGSNIW